MPSPWHRVGVRLRVRKVCVGAFENNAYVVACAETGAALLVDAADEADRLADELSDVQPVAIVTTHGHPDHVGAVADLVARFDVPAYIHPADRFLLADDASEAHTARAEDDMVLEVGRLAVRLVHTPGHTPGSTCLVVEDEDRSHVFSGDTLFPGGPGATRWAYSSFETIMSSIESRLMTLPDDTLVHPGHGLDTTIGTERPAIPTWRRRGW